MGVVNVTPDSFSDGGRFHEPQAAIEHALELVAEGAQILDIGGESTRPGAEPVDADEELHRVLPVLEGLARQTDARLSIDTTKSVVARAALAAGASIVNDVSAGQDDPDMWPLVAEMGCEYVLMHRQGRPRSMQIAPTYDDPVREVCEELRRRVAACLKAGVGATRIIADPGIGFGKRLRHNLALLQHLPELRSLGLPLLLGVSRKSFIGHVTGAEEEKDFRGRSRTDRPVERIGGTAAALTACVWGGAEILRIHDVRIMSEAVQVAHALTQPAPYL
ncbi:MAG: dihydropteroate synthase [bacterium]|nr:dihydropteroate synthase [bacterium]